MNKKSGIIKEGLLVTIASLLTYFGSCLYAVFSDLHGF